MSNSKETFMKAFSFKEDELTANKQGKLTARQLKTLDQHIRISRFSSMLAMVFTAISILCVFGFPFFASQGTGLGQAAPFLAGTAFVTFAITGVFTYIGLRRLRTLQNKEVSVQEGPLRLDAKNLDYGTMKAHYAWINGFRFQLTSEAQFKALVNGEKYRVYYVHYPPTHIILSLEELG